MEAKDPVHYSDLAQMLCPGFTESTYLTRRLAEAEA